MKKKLFAIALCICTALSVVGCGKDGDKEEKTEAKFELGQYKGIKVDSSLSTVEQRDIDEYIEAFLKGNAKDEEVKEGVLEKDGKAKISYTSTVDGKEYKNAEGSTITLDATGFSIDGFVDGLIGKKVGDKVTLNLKVPSDFSDTTVAGKEIVFEVTVEAKVNTVVPELTDEFVKENYAYLNLSNVAEFKKYITEEVLYIDQIYAEIWDEVVNNLKVESYDSEKLKTVKKEMAESFEYELYMYYGMDLDAYLTSASMSKEDYDKNMEESAKAYLKQEMLINAIAEKEGIEVTDEVYKENMQEMAGAYGYKTIEEFEKALEGNMTKEDFEYSILTYIVEEFVCKNVEFVDGYGFGKEEESSSNTSTETTDSNEAATEEETTK